MTSLYDLTVPFLVNALKAEQHLLEKAEAFEGVSTTDLLEVRLAPDMWPLSQQFVISAIHAISVIAKLTGAAPPKINFGPASLEDTKKYLAEAIEFVQAATPESINGKENEVLSAVFGANNEINLKAIDYVQGYLTPNVFFHLTTSYDILRSKGVQLGKSDFIRGFIRIAS
ncbi:hypothetical protein F5Y12DRAFT_720176 [Xylaria sp. FL1777]|nr:hypothetical protein F5Y12DRAFT_720176 [Xylaria sp. FL1777]